VKDEVIETLNSLIIDIKEILERLDVLQFDKLPGLNQRHLRILRKFVCKLLRY